MKPMLVAVLLAGCASSTEPPVGSWNVTPLTAWTCQSPPPKPVKFELTDEVNDLGHRDVLVTFEDGEISSSDWWLEHGQVFIRYVDSTHGHTGWRAQVAVLLDVEKTSSQGAWDTDAESRPHCHFEFTAELQ